MSSKQRCLRALFAFILIVSTLAGGFAAAQTSSGVLWQSGFESGSFSDFYDVTTSGCANSKVVAGPTHSGSQAGALTVCNGDGGVRARVERFSGAGSAGLPDDAYYSVWMNFGTPWSGDDTNFFQYKKSVVIPGGQTTKHVLMGLYARPDPGNGRFEIRLKSKISDAGVWDDTQRVLAGGVYVTANTWNKFELRYKWGSSDGAIQLWVNDQPAFDLSGRTTDPQRLVHRSKDGGDGSVQTWQVGGGGPERQWTINHYLVGSTPANTTIYADDAAVSLSRGAGAAALVFNGRFRDDDGNMHEANIESIAEAGITKGCGGDMYCPRQAVTRAQMAAYVVRALEGEPPRGGTGGFSDVGAGDWFAPYVDRLVELGVASRASRYRPDQPVSRQEAAAFLVRAFHGEDLPTAAGAFADVDPGSWAARYIEQLQRMGVTKGCSSSPARFCPFDALPRDEMASFVARILAGS